MTSNEANTMCCSLGMNSVAVETLEENQCITSAFGLYISDNFLAQIDNMFHKKRPPVCRANFTGRLRAREDATCSSSGARRT